MRWRKKNYGTSERENVKINYGSSERDKKI